MIGHNIISDKHSLFVIDFLELVERIMKKAYICLLMDRPEGFIYYCFCETPRIANLQLSD